MQEACERAEALKRTTYLFSEQGTQMMQDVLGKHSLETLLRNNHSSLRLDRSEKATLPGDNREMAFGLSSHIDRSIGHELHFEVVHERRMR